MLSHLRAGVISTLILTAVCGLAYPLAMTGVAGVLFPHQAHGSLITAGDKVIGSELIGQSFSKPEYFHSRPSATVDTDPKDATKTIPSPYNAGSSVGTNYAPTAKALVGDTTERVKALKEENPDAQGPVPVDLAATSGSGLDPHITPEAALWQAPRVAKARNLPLDKVQALVHDHTEGRTLGLLGEPRVNVLALNLALDGQAAVH